MSRSCLSEGRQHGIGFGFAKKEGDTLTLVQPISPCKDYLNDVVWSEATGKPYQIYGLKTTKQDIFSEGIGWLVFGVCKYKAGADYGSFDKDSAALDANILNIQSAINWFEDKMGVQESSVLKLEDNRFVVVAPKFWVESTYRISLYSLIIRAALHFKGGDILDYLYKLEDADRYIFNGIKPKIESMLAGKIPVQDMSKVTSPHGLGILGFQF